MLSSLLLSIACKSIYIINTPVLFLLFCYFINTTLLLFYLYPKILYRNLYMLNKMFLFFFSFLFFSSNKIYFDISYGINCIFIILFIFLLYFVYYFLYLKSGVKSKGIQINFSSYIFDYFIMLFFLLFDISSNIIIIPVFSCLFDFICVAVITEISLQLNKKFKKI